MTTWTLLAVTVALFLGIPVWPWSRGFGWYPIFIAGAALVVLEILMLVQW
jgi:hypothetical protein